MCGRFVSSTPASVLAAQFRVDEIRAAELPPRWNVAPTDEVLAVATGRGVRRLGSFSWGLLPGPGAARRLINLRAETLATRPTFRRRLQRNRCVVPADGFYEWKVVAPGQPKVPYFISARDGRPLALAGLWGAVRQPDETWLRTCTILTGAPNDLVAGVHARMPVILPEPAWEVWLDDTEENVAALSALLVPAPSELLAMWPVGTAVNKVAHDGRELVTPALSRK
ncbi:MAG: SOS response-associated peptidase [Acidimicrobiales bacterium]